MFGISSHNSIVPSDRQHDEHYAHRCCDCETEFGRFIRPADQCKEGDLCADCAEAREALEKSED